MQPLSDEILMSQVKAGETQALGELYERYKSKLFTYFLRVSGDRAASNDLLMNTFERLYKYRKGFKEDAAFRPWCYQIANNLLKDHFKRQRRNAKLTKAHFTQNEAIHQLEIDNPPNYNVLHKALDQLNPLDKRIITQYYLMEAPYNEIAVMENISVNSARIRVCRTLKQLKELLKNADL
ncbi:MAG: sigma-70 family RNA polymerase sigma factor [Eudoraea sp.]|nr:sigma-70 family RNA polymerase sigma factor [Eudoraea sp.]NNJ39901.1 sigma-70 family RNA polymerase sigma factor [Eudoraea sp.]